MILLALLLIINTIILIWGIISLKNNRDYFNNDNRFYKNYIKRSKDSSIKAVILIIVSHLDRDDRYKSAYEI